MSEIALPKVDRLTVSKKDIIVSSLKNFTSKGNVLSELDEIRPYETDALAAYKNLPLAVVLPENTEEVSDILKYCHQENIKVIPRGAGTGLSGGALPLNDAIILGLGKFNKILDIDFDNKCVVTQPGVTNLSITHAVKHKGYYYAPDPSSQLACSIGGNVAENSGGVHSLKYGTTTNNILGVEMVMMDGTICKLGGKTLDQEGYDLLGLICGSEGLLGVITEVTVKILKNPQTVKAALIGFPTIEDGGNCVTDIISNGIVPAGMEIMDKALIDATEKFVHAGYPMDAEVLMIVELDGTKSEVDELFKQIKEIAENKRAEIVHRLATLEKVSPKVLKDLDEALQIEFKYSGAIIENKLGGKAAAARLMGSLDKTTESMILSSIDGIDPDVANEIRKLRFKFEDVQKIDDEGIRLILREVSSEDLLVALKTASDELKIKIFTNMSDRVANLLQEDLEFLGPTKISAVEKAQQKIVSICRHLEENGTIMIGQGEALV